MRSNLLAAAALAVCVLVAHGGSLFDGLFFDDYWHRHTLTELGWGWSDLVESATFDVPGELVNHWWQTEPLKWRYARPVAMFFMKIEYLVSGGNPIGIHAFSLAWHWLAAWFVFLIARCALRHRGWAFLAAVLFVVEPQSAFSLSWTAARNAIISGCFFLIAIYAYLRAYGACWQDQAGVGGTVWRSQAVDHGLPPSASDRATPPNLASSRGAGPNLNRGAATGRSQGRKPLDQNASLGQALEGRQDDAASTDSLARANLTWLITAIIFWLLALFSRETAIIFPLVVLLFDASSRRFTALLKRLPIYLGLGLIAVAYLYWRLRIFPIADTPNIYYTSAAGPEYLLWAASKLMQCLMAMWYDLPLFLGIATYQGVGSGLIITHVVMLVLLGLMAWWYLWASRGLATRWVWPAWCIAAFLPVLPVFLMPHFAYLPAAAVSIMLAIMLRRMSGKPRVAVAVLIVASHCWSLAIYRFVWRGIVRSEQVIYADIADHTPPPAPGAKLFFINLPVAGIYGTVAMRQHWGVDDLDGYVLTYARHPLRADDRCTIARAGPDRLVLTSPAPGFFSGLSGAMLLDGMRPGEPLANADVIEGAEFDVSVIASDDGITRLEFTFPKPLDSPEYLFYVSSHDRPAARVLFDGEGGVTAQEDPQWFDDRATMLREREYYFTVIEIVGRIVQSDLVLTGAKESRSRDTVARD